MTPEQEIKKLNKEIATLKRANGNLSNAFDWEHKFHLEAKANLAKARELAYKDLILELFKKGQAQ